MRSLPILFCLSLSLAAHADDLPALTAEGKALIPPFQQQLMATVKNAMQAGGPVKAVESCQLLAPQIASQHSQTPWTVGRTSLQVRNPANTADAWEQQVLKDFATQQANGQPLIGMQQVAKVDGELRIMQAIPVGEPCLACHGKNLKPEVAAKIDQLYPKDQARGYDLGQLRGAFTLRRTLENPSDQH
jgi:hypothetical protein